MNQSCPHCSQKDGEYADVDRCQTLVGGAVMITFWLCRKCNQATALTPETLYALKPGELDRLTEYFKGRGLLLDKQRLRKTESGDVVITI